MNALPRAARWYLYCLWVASALAVGSSLWVLRASPLNPLLVLGALVAFALADYFVVIYGEDERNQIAMTVVDALAVFLVGATGIYGLLPIVAGTLISDTFGQRPWFKSLFNAAQRALTFLVMLGLYRLIVIPGEPAFSGPHGLVAFLTMSATYHSLNTIFVTTIVALANGQPLVRVYAQGFRQVHWVHYITLPFGAILAYIWDTNPWMLGPAALPLVMAQRSFRAMAELQAQNMRNKELAAEATRLLNELKTKQDELLRSSKLAALGTFAAGIGHEFNNLLAAILGNAQLGLMGDSLEEKNRALEVVMRASVRGSSITGGLLTFARRRDPKREACDLAEVVTDTITLVRSDFSRLNVRIEPRIDAVPTVICDSGQIAQVLMNLLTNARDAMAERHGGPIQVELRHQDGSVELSVTDCGGGIPEELLPHIFQPFMTTKTEEGSTGRAGTGLGLAISHSIIESHHGAITVRSTPGQGTTMTVRLPVAEEEHPAPAPPAEEPPPMRVLVIDDDPDISDWLRRGLDRASHSVVVAATAHAALQMYRQQPFDLVICDVTIPGMRGAELVRRLRAISAETQILAMSGQTGTYEAEEMLAAGAVTVLSKPFSYEELLGEVRGAAQARFRAVG